MTQEQEQKKEWHQIQARGGEHDLTPRRQHQRLAKTTSALGDKEGVGWGYANRTPFIPPYKARVSSRARPSGPGQRLSLQSTHEMGPNKPIFLVYSMY
jgi:hypothetical protein